MSCYNFWFYLNFFCLIIVLVYATIMFLKTYWRRFVEYMFNIESRWYDRDVERPRLFIFLVIFFVLYIAGRLLGYSGFFSASLFSPILSILVSLLVVFSSFLLYVVLGEKFRLRVAKKKEKVIERSEPLRMRTGINIDDIISKLISRGYFVKDDVNSLRELFNTRKCTKVINVNYRGERNKEYSYLPIFIFLQLVVENNIFIIDQENDNKKRPIKGRKRKELLELIVLNFKKGGKGIICSNIQTAYTTANFDSILKLAE